MEEVLSTTRSRISRTKRYSSNLTDGLKQCFEDAGIGGVEKRVISIMDTGARLTKVTENRKEW